MPRTTSFEVSGKGRFPVDMLRYDQAWPRDPESAEVIFTPEDRAERSRMRTLHLCTARNAAPHVRALGLVRLARHRLLR